MADGGGVHVCGPCKSRHLKVIATSWCPECDDGLCQQCLEYHSESKSLRKHQTIPVESFQELSSVLQNISQVCESHGESLDLFCSSHQEPCCTECISLLHNNCPGITLLSKVVHGVKTSEYFSTVEKSMKDMKSNLTKMKENREVKKEKLEEQRHLLKSRVQAFEEKLISHLDILKTKMYEEIDTTINNQIAIIDEADITMNDKLVRLEDTQRNMTKIAAHGTEIQIYMALRNVEETMIEDIKGFSMLLETGAMKDINVDFNIAKQFRQLLTIQSLGFLIISEDTVGIDFLDIKPEKAQMSTSKSSVCKNIQLNHLKSTVTSNLMKLKANINITAVCVVPDGTIILVHSDRANGCGNLCILDKDGRFKMKVNCESCPFGVAVVNENKVAVSSYTDKSLSIYDTKNFIVQEKIATGYIHWGLSCQENQVISGVRGTGIAVFSTSGKLLKLFPVDFMMLAYVHYANKRIFYTNYMEDILFCLGADGEMLWDVKFEDMKGPRNICTDHLGNVFVASMDSNKVIVVSSDGKTCKVLLSDNDGVKQPKAICFDAAQSLLVVASINGNVYLYKVSYDYNIPIVL